MGVIFFYFNPKAMPTAMGKPWPRDPVDASTPMNFIFYRDVRQENCRIYRNFQVPMPEKNPFCASTTYNPIAALPFA